MSFDSSMAATALWLINKRGKTVTFYRVTQGAYDPATGLAIATESAITIKALVQDFSRASDGFAFASGLVIDGDKRLSVAASSLSFAPMPGDKVTVDGNIYTVQDVKTTFAGELPVLYDMRGRT